MSLSNEMKRKHTKKDRSLISEIELKLTVLEHMVKGSSQQLSNREIADATGIPRQVINVIYNRALNKIKAIKDPVLSQYYKENRK